MTDIMEDSFSAQAERIEGLIKGNYITPELGSILLSYYALGRNQAANEKCDVVSAAKVFNSNHVETMQKFRASQPAKLILEDNIKSKTNIKSIIFWGLSVSVSIFAAYYFQHTGKNNSFLENERIYSEMRDMIGNCNTNDNGYKVTCNKGINTVTKNKNGMTYIIQMDSTQYNSTFQEYPSNNPNLGIIDVEVEMQPSNK